MAPSAQSLSYGKPASASSQTFFGTAEAAFNGDSVGHGWRPESSDRQPWLAVDLGATASIGRIFLFEDGKRIRKFKLEGKTGGGWKLLHEGERVGPRLELPLAATAEAFRVTVLESDGAPAFREIVVLD